MLTVDDDGTMATTRWKGLRLLMMTRWNETRMFQRVVVIGYEWRRGILHLLAIEYGIVVTSRDTETTTTIALHCLLAFLTLYGESYIQPSVLFVNPSWVLVSTKQPGGLLANFVTVSSRAALSRFQDERLIARFGDHMWEGTVSSWAALSTDSAEEQSRSRLFTDYLGHFDRHSESTLLVARI